MATTDLPVPPALTERLSAPSPPSQQSFPWRRDHWLKWLHGISSTEFLNTLPARLDPPGVSDRAQEALATGDVADAFVVAMIWGHGTSNYGAYRTAKVLTDSRNPLGNPADKQVLARLQHSAKVVGDDGPAEAFNYLAREPIRYLGPAFATKWLYFASTAKGHHANDAAPILDRLVRDWLAGQGLTLRITATNDYKAYVDLLGAWGKPHARTPVQVEESIFLLIREQQR